MVKIATLIFVFLLSQSVFSQNLFVRVRTQKNLDVRPQITEIKNIKSLIIKKENQKFDVISIVPMEDYLAGVVSKEMPLSWPKEALKAQAVVARSYVLARMSERKNKNFYVESDQLDQVFEVTDSKKAYEAVRETENVFLMDENFKILKAFYHADCGGQTIPANLVWPGAVDSGTAVDPWCKLKNKNQWSFSVPIDQVTDDFEVQIRKINTKIFEVAGQSVQKLREKFGFDQIRNSPSEIQVKADQITFSGQGYGHGAGLCQWGTLAQARIGRGYLDIIKHYYPKAILSDDRRKLAKNKNDFANSLVF